MCGVLEQDQLPLGGQGRELRGLARVAAVGHVEDRAGVVAGDRGGGVGREPGPLEPGDVGEYRFRSHVSNRVDGGDEGERWHDHLVAGAEPCSEADQVQGGGAVGDSGGVLRRLRRRSVEQLVCGPMLSQPER